MTRAYIAGFSKAATDFGFCANALLKLAQPTMPSDSHFNNVQEELSRVSEYAKQRGVQQGGKLKVPAHVVFPDLLKEHSPEEIESVRNQLRNQMNLVQSGAGHVQTASTTSNNTSNTNEIVQTSAPDVPMTTQNNYSFLQNDSPKVRINNTEF